MRSPQVIFEYLLVTGLLVFSVVCQGALIKFALPGPELIEIGSLSDFPPAPNPYSYQREFSFFIVNQGNEIIALGRNADSIQGVPRNVIWNSRENYFSNPFGGTRYNLTGCPIWWAKNFETVSPMIRYPVEIHEGRIQVVVSDPFPACEEMFKTLTLSR